MNSGWDDFGIPGIGDVCEVAHNLLDHCGNSGPQDIQHLDPSNHWYKASQFPEVPNCACTMVMYNLLSACAGCQKWATSSSDIDNQKWQNLTSYEAGKCGEFQDDNDSGLQVEPAGNSTGSAWHDSTMLPEWSMKLKDTTFNFATANGFVQANKPPSTPSTTDNLVPASTSTSVSAPATSTTSSKSGPNIGAIVGGVIAGLVFLGVIVGLVLFLRRRKRHARDVAPSDEFLKPEYYTSPPLLPTTQGRGDSEYRDDIEEEAVPPMLSNRLSWGGGLVPTRRLDNDDEESEMLPPFTRGTYIGPSPHEKDQPSRRQTDDSDATATSNTHLLQSGSRPGTSEDT